MSFQDFTTWRDNPEPLAPFLSVIIPAYNEAGRIVPTIASIVAHLVERPYSFELIVSDDGSTDGTARTTRRASRNRTLGAVHRCRPVDADRRD